MDRRSDGGSSAQPEPTSYPPPPAEQETDTYDELKKLGELHAQGILTDEEFSAEKAKLLADN